MNRPAPIKPDNVFLLVFHALRQRRVPLVLRIASHSLLLVTLALLIYTLVVGLQLRQTMQQQAEAVGQSLLIQTASSATQLLVSNDLLSLNVLLSNLVDNPLVAHAALYSVDNRILAEAGSRPKQSLLGDSHGLYSTPIAFQEVMAGHLRLSLDMQHFQQPMILSLQSMGLLSLILLALTLTLSMRLGRHISAPLLQLRHWLRDPDDPAPGAGRQDEIGDLARQLQSRLVPEKPHAASTQPEQWTDPEYPQGAFDDDFDEDADDKPMRITEPSAGTHPAAPRVRHSVAVLPVMSTFKRRDGREPRIDSLDDADLDDPFATLRDELADTQAAEHAARAAHSKTFARPHAPAAGAPQLRHAHASQGQATGVQASAVLAVQLGAQEQLRRLPRARLEQLLQRYQDCLNQAAALYQGELHTLSDGSSLLLFHSRDSGVEYLTHALCCGELLRAVGHALQIEVVDHDISLQMHLGLTQGPALLGLNQGELLLSDTAQAALTLSQHSCNLLLVARSIGDDPLLHQRARIRAIAKPQGACCVERLLEPYTSLLERQLARMREA
ncbi:MAG: histidine kinase [Pseudomonas sp.]